MSDTIGLLLPQSNIYASSKDFVWGFRKGLEKASDFEVKLAIENTGYCSTTLIEQQYVKMALQNQPNVIVGISHWRPIAEKTNLFTQYRIPTLFSEIGANLPLPEILNENVYFNSLNLWQSAYGIGKYMAQQGYKKVMYMSHFYDGGYHVPYGFCKGLMDNGGNITAPFGIKDSYTSEELERLDKHLIAEKPEALYCIYSNPRHYNLLEWIRESSPVKDIPIFACPYWVDDDLLVDRQNKATLGIYSANSWSRQFDNPINKKLVKDYEEDEEITCSAFVIMGYESGSLLAQAYKALGDKWYKKKSLRDFLMNAKLEGPRNGHHFNEKYQYSFGEHHLRQVQQTENGLENVVLQQLDIEGSLNVIEPLYQAPSSGWDNPYLCV